MRGTLKERFLDKVMPEPNTGCWLWLGRWGRKGYGKINEGGRGGRLLAAHRVSYELFVGQIPDGLEIDHLCCVTSCVNPDHLEAVTMHENMRRRYARVTHCRRGHEFNPGNTTIQLKNGKYKTRICVTCAQAHKRAYKARQKLKAKGIL